MSSTQPTAPNKPQRILIASLELNHESLTNADYHARPELGSSTLKALDRDGAEVANLKQSGLVEFDSRALVVGSAVHSWFEGDESRYVAAPDARGYKSADAGPFEAMAAEAEAAGKILLTADEFATVRGCSDAIAHKLGPYLVGKQRWVEPSIFWNQRVEGGAAGEFVSCKCRPDVLLDNGDRTATYIELKTAAANGARDWKSAMWRYGYHIQAPHYAAGIRAATGCDVVRVVFVVVRKPAPFVVRLYQMDEITSACAERRWADLVAEYSRRLRECDWVDETWMKPTQIDLGMAMQDDLEESEG